MKGKLLLFGASLLAMATLGVVQLQTNALDGGRDCDRFAVVWCGAMTRTEVISEYDTNGASNANGYTTAQGDIKKIFNAMGISRDDLYLQSKAGVVYRDGTVKVDGQVVATGAQMAARGLGGTQIAGTNAQKVSVSAMGDDQTAHVYYKKDGTFAFAVMKPCANPVMATPKQPPVKPPETPKKPGVSVEKYVNNDKKYARVGENVEYTYRLVVKNTGETDLADVKVSDVAQKGITLLSVNPPVGSITTNQNGQYVFSYTIPKLLKGESRTFGLKAKVPAYLAGKLVNTVCVDAPSVPGSPDDCDKAEVDVPPTPPAPGKDEVCLKDEDRYVEIDEGTFDESIHSRNPEDCQTPELPAELPETGPAETIMSVVGAMSLVGASAYYIASRRAL